MTYATIIAAIGVIMTMLGCAVTVGLVLGKVNMIEEVRKSLDRLVQSNHVQDLTLARITEHLGIDPHRATSSKLYESR